MGESVFLMEDFLKWPFPIGVVTYLHNTTVEPHTHDFYELVFISRGLAIHICNGDLSFLSQGDLFLVRPGDVHSYMNAKKMIVYNCLFRITAFGEDWPALNALPGFKEFLGLTISEVSKSRKVHLPLQEWEVAEATLRSMVEEETLQQPGWELDLKFRLGQLLILGARSFMENKRSTQDDASSTPARTTILGNSFEAKFSQIEPALSFIDANLSRSINVDMLAQLCHLSQGYFSRVFKDIMGSTPLDYITMKRIEHAALRLHDTSMPISQVAEEIGILDPNYFSRLFRKTMGMTPSSYRIKVTKMIRRQECANRGGLRPIG